MKTDRNLSIDRNRKQPRCPSTGEWIHTFVVYPCNGVLDSNKKDQTTDAHKNVAESHNYKVEWKKPDIVHSVWFYDIQKQAKLMNSDKVVGSGYLLGGSTGDVYLDLGGVYMGVYICKNLSSCTFKIWALYKFNASI